MITKELKKELRDAYKKELKLNTKDLTVKGSVDELVVVIKSLKALKQYDSVKKYAMVHESIERDERTGDLMSGGTFVTIQVEKSAYSEFETIVNELVNKAKNNKNSTAKHGNLRIFADDGEAWLFTDGRVGSIANYPEYRTDLIAQEFAKHLKITTKEERRRCARGILTIVSNHEYSDIAKSERLKLELDRVQNPGRILIDFTIFDGGNFFRFHLEFKDYIELEELHKALDKEYFLPKLGLPRRTVKDLSFSI